MTRHARRAALAATLVVAAAAARAEPPVVRAEPAVVVLGTDGGARIVVDGAGATPPVLSTNAGRVEALTAEGEGRFSATWIPPAAWHPHVAIVSAVTERGAAWTAIPLVGRGVALARSKPHAPIRVTIGDASFGPVVADARGEARVPVRVAPGVRFALHRDTQLDLHVPPSLHVQLALPRAEARADQPLELPLFLFAVAADGSPRRGAPVDVEVSEGSVGPVAEVAPGAFTATWSLPPGAPGTAIATARLRDEPGPAHAVSLARPAGSPARLAVEADRAPVVVGTGPITVRLAVADAAGNPVDAEATVEATVGTVGALRRTAAGRYAASWSVPDALGDTRRSAIVARAPGLEARAEVAIVPAAAASLLVAAEVPSIVADGGAEARVRVEVTDRFGNRVEGAAPQVDTTRRASVSTEATPGGAWVVRYRPARAREAGTELLSIRAGDLTGAARLEVLAPRRTLSVAPKLGLATSLAGSRSAYAGAEAAYESALLGGRLGLALELGTFAHDRTDVVPVGAGELRVSGRARYVSLLASGRWRHDLGRRWVAWTDAGGGVAQVAAEVSAGTAPVERESGAALAVHAAAALGLRLGHGAPFVELRGARFSDPGFEALRGSLTVVTVALGYRHDAY